VVIKTNKKEKEVLSLICETFGRALDSLMPLSPDPTITVTFIDFENSGRKGED